MSKKIEECICLSILMVICTFLQLFWNAHDYMNGIKSFFDMSYGLWLIMLKFLNVY